MDCRERPKRFRKRLPLVGCVLALACLDVGATQPTAIHAGMTDKARERPRDLSSSDMEWVDIASGDFPRAALSTFPITFRDPPARRFALVDLNGDGVEEVIIASSDFPSGGREYLLLMRRGRRWQNIGEIQGGLTLSLANANSVGSFYAITSFYRSGDIYENRFRFSKGRYRLVSQSELPRAVSRSCWWDWFWWRLNAVGAGEEENRRGQVYEDACKMLRAPWALGK